MPVDGPASLTDGCCEGFGVGVPCFGVALGTGVTVDEGVADAVGDGVALGVPCFGVALGTGVTFDGAQCQGERFPGRAACQGEILNSRMHTVDRAVHIVEQIFGQMHAMHVPDSKQGDCSSASLQRRSAS